MFKYIKEILITFTPGQRLIALLLLLFSVCLVVIGPKVINLLTHDDTLIENRLNRQKQLIDQQGVEIKRLNDSIISSQINCTNRLISREQELYIMVEKIERLAAQSTNTKKGRSPASEPLLVDSMIVFSNTNEILKGLKDIKKELGGSINAIH